MPDHFDDRLHSLDGEPPFTAPSAASIRRRGDRLRRRNHAAAAIGSVLAAALVALPVHSLSDRDGTSSLPPAEQTQVPPPTEPTTEPVKKTGSSAIDAVTLADLPERERLGDWRELEPDGDALACVPDRVVDEMSAERTDQRFGAYVAAAEEAGPFTSEIRVTVLDFGTNKASTSAFGEAVNRLINCVAPDIRLDLGKPSIPGGAGAPSQESVSTEPVVEGYWEMYLRDASDVCTDCDAVRFDRQAVIRSGDRVALISLAEVGGPLEPEGLKKSMGELVQAVATAGAEQPSPTPTEDGSSPASTSLLSTADLPERDRLGEWEGAKPAGPTLTCVPADVVNGMDAEILAHQRFGADIKGAPSSPPPYASEIRVTVLGFATAEQATDAQQSVASWLQDCAAEDLVHKGTQASQETVSTAPIADGFWETFYRGASDVCTECDAVRFDRQGVVRTGDRLALISLVEIGGPLEPGGLKRSMGELVQAVVAAAEAE